MCTVIYYPTEQTTYIVSLRDENIYRPEAHVPQVYQHNNLSYIAPKDGLAGGTWIGLNEFGSTNVLLNGAFINHDQTKIYKESRGSLLLSMLRSNEPLEVWDATDLSNIAPCTIITLQHYEPIQLVWDGYQKHQIKLNPTVPYIWSSVTLYNETARQNRYNQFNDWVQKKHSFSIENILSFFKESADEQNGFFINRTNHIKTLSCSYIEIYKEKEGKLTYLDFIKNTESIVRLSLRQNKHDFTKESAKSI